MNADITNYDSRIADGKAVEKKIISALRSNGIKVEDPTAHEDMHDKIDGWFVYKDGTRHSVQIKFRESGDDILFEIIKNWDANIIGRDLVSKAEYYLIVDRNGYGRLFNTQPIKLMAEKVLHFVKETLKLNANRTTWEFANKWQAKITIDRAHGNRKLMAYFNPSTFVSVKEWANLI